MIVLHRDNDCGVETGSDVDPAAAAAAVVCVCYDAVSRRAVAVSRALLMLVSDTSSSFLFDCFCCYWYFL